MAQESTAALPDDHRSLSSTLFRPPWAAPTWCADLHTSKTFKKFFVLMFKTAFHITQCWPQISYVAKTGLDLLSFLPALLKCKDLKNTSASAAS